jgi:adenylosuccinate lyase
MNIDLEKNWVVVSEAIQTILRREGVRNPYQLLKDFTRGNLITKQILENFVKKLDIDPKVKEEIQKITPYNYTGI